MHRMGAAYRCEQRYRHEPRAGEEQKAESPFGAQQSQQESYGDKRDEKRPDKDVPGCETTVKSRVPPHKEQAEQRETNFTHHSTHNNRIIPY